MLEVKALKTISLFREIIGFDWLVGGHNFFIRNYKSQFSQN